jgi:hypothetical protein
MKSKKKSKKVKPRIKVAPPSKKHKSKKDYNRKTKTASLAQTILEDQARNPYAGSRFEDFMKLEQECFGLTTEKCDCTPEKGCLDNEPELAKESTQAHNEQQKMSWIDNFFSIFGFKRRD